MIEEIVIVFLTILFLIFILFLIKDVYLTIKNGLANKDFESELDEPLKEVKRGRPPKVKKLIHPDDLGNYFEK